MDRRRSRPMKRQSRFWRAIDALLSILFVGLLVRLVMVSDPGRIWSYLQRMGPSVLAVLGLALVTLALETLSWSLCSTKSSGTHYHHYLGAILPGQALNNLLPSGNVGELLKSRLISRRVGMDQAVVSLVLYNYISFTVATFLMLLGALFSVLAPEVPSGLSLALLVAAVSVVIVTLGIRWALRRGVSSALARVGTRLFRVKDRKGWIDRACQADEHIRTARARDPARFAASVLSMLGARGSQIAEVSLICWAFGAPITLAQAFAVQVTSQLVIWVLSFIPGQVYVLEEGSRRVFSYLGLNPLLGLSMELVRRARKQLNITTGMTVLLLLNIRSSRGDDREAS